MKVWEERGRQGEMKPKGENGFEIGLFLQAKIKASAKALGRHLYSTLWQAGPWKAKKLGTLAKLHEPSCMPTQVKLKGA